MFKAIPKISTRRFRARFISVSWRDLTVTVLPVLLLTAMAVWATFRFIRPAPPSVLTISTGPAESAYQRMAERYRDVLLKNGITLNVLPSEGALDNLRRLSDPSQNVDVAFVQVGVSLADDPRGALTVSLEPELLSLGSVAYQPLYVFYRAKAPIERLSDLTGKRLSLGPVGSGARVIELALLKANGIEPGGKTALTTIDDDLVTEALIKGKIDAAFLMGDSASPAIIRALLRRPDVRLLDFKQSEAYARRYAYLNRVVLPMGAYDFGKNLPAQDVALMAATVEVVARPELHPAVSDLLIEAMKVAHGRPGLLHSAGEFPAPREHDRPISEGAQRYYKSGKGYVYRVLPFWLASLVDRFLVVLLPLVVVLVPGMRVVPPLYRWRIRSRLYKIYGALLTLERDVLDHAREERPALLRRLDEVEQLAGGLKIPLSFADQFYVLREHISFVRARLVEAAGPAAVVDAGVPLADVAAAPTKP